MQATEEENCRPGRGAHIMACCDFYGFDEKTTRSSHSDDPSNGEREYREHVRGQMLSIGERMMVFLVVALISGLALGGHFSGSASSHPAPMTTASTVRTAPDWQERIHCQEQSPYGDASC
jgi:hypothetical protein